MRLAACFASVCLSATGILAWSLLFIRPPLLRSGSDETAVQLVVILNLHFAVFEVRRVGLPFPAFRE